ncbi:hypothetical protein [Selenomonas ruminantium]|uniref:hypothetical protein n=1 Tax=Selenomonas ruminantium TaxID=971 RepID=UPI000AE9D949|nr:hypothetical protein [Selenomonas ruminantium]
MIFINNTPIFYLARKVLFDSTIGLSFLFVIATTLFVYIEFNVTWIMPFNSIVALLLSLACLRNYRNTIQYYTAVRQECVDNINRILHTVPDNLSEDEQRIHSDISYARQRGLMPVYVAKLSLSYFNAHIAEWNKKFYSKHRLLNHSNNASLVLMILSAIILILSRP